MSLPLRKSALAASYFPELASHQACNRLRRWIIRCTELYDKVLCVIDLDTVMPGFVLSDIGDFIRTGANTGAEDDENLDNVNVNMEIFKAYTRGYMEKAKAFLTPTEIKLLPYGGRLLTYMQTVRFLTDYINGDTYYKIHSPKHNLIRTKAQFKLLQSLEAHAEEMDQFMNQWL